MSPRVSIAITTDRPRDDAIVGPRVLPRCIPGTIPTTTTGLNDTPSSRDVAAKMVSFLPKIRRTTPRVSMASCGDDPSRSIVGGGAVLSAPTRIDRMASVIRKKLVRDRAGSLTATSRHGSRGPVACRGGLGTGCAWLIRMEMSLEYLTLMADRFRALPEPVGAGAKPS